MNLLNTIQLKKIRDYVVISGVYDDDLEQELTDDLACDVERLMILDKSTFEAAFAQAKLEATPERLAEVQFRRRLTKAYRNQLKVDTAKSIGILTGLSILMYAWAYSDGELGYFLYGLYDSLPVSLACCTPFAIWRLFELRKDLKAIDMELGRI